MEKPNRNTYTVVFRETDGWWMGWIKEIPGVNCQERTKAELFETLRATLGEALELNEREAIEAAGEDFTEKLLRL